MMMLPAVGRFIAELEGMPLRKLMQAFDELEIARPKLITASSKIVAPDGVGMPGDASHPPDSADPVDRSQRCLSGGSAVTEDHRELKPDGQQRGYVVLSPAERAKGFVRPVRRTYIHKACGSPTTMSSSIAETYARDPGFYGATFCIRCGTHFPVGEFVWIDSNEPVGS